jgi:hypothetical protein
MYLALNYFSRIPGKKSEKSESHQFSHASYPEACEKNSVMAGFLTYPINRRPSHPDQIGTVAIDYR